MKFNEIKERIVADDEAKKEQKERAEKAIEDYLDYTASIIEAHMTLNVSDKSVFANIAREAVPEDFWERFESNELLFKTRLPEVLNKKLGQGIKVTFNSLIYDKVKTEEDEYIFFSFSVELD